MHGAPELSRMASRNLNDGAWHVDRQVPIALIMTLVLGGIAHTGTLVWWASNVTERVATLERAVVAAAPQGDRLTRVEVKIETIQSGIDEIKALIRQRPAEPRSRSESP